MRPFRNPFEQPDPANNAGPEGFGTLRQQQQQQRPFVQPSPQHPQAVERPAQLDPRRMSVAGRAAADFDRLYDPSAQPVPFVIPPPTPPPPTPPSPALSNVPESLATEMMRQFGFEKDKVSYHWSFTEVLESMWQDAGFVFTGNFTEGWGYSTVRVDGRCGYDSALNWKYIVPGYTVHIAGVCCCRQQVNKVTLNADGSMTLNQDCLVHLRAMDLVKDDAVLMVSDVRRREINRLGLTASGPALMIQQVFACCQRPRLPRFEALNLPDLASQPVFVRPDEYEVQLVGRNSKPPTGRLDLSMLDRALFRRLSNEQGRLYVALKVLLLEELPKTPNFPGGACFSEVHCKQALLHYLLTRRPSGDVASDVQGALRLLISSNSDGPLLRDNQMRSAVLPAAFIPLASACQAAQLHKALNTLVDNSERLLIERFRRLKSARGEAVLSFAIFQPMSLSIPGHKRQLTASTATFRTLAGCRDISFLVYRAIERLLRPTLSGIEDLQADIAALRPVAGVAAVCLQCLMHLKLDEREPARNALRDSRAAMSRVLRDFPAAARRESIEQNLLSSLDSAWQFKAKIAIEETEHTSTQRVRPLGTAFLAAYPLIRYVFFPCRVMQMQQMNGCVMDYTLNINFLALMNCLVVQTVPLQTQNTELWRWFDSGKPLDAQELFALSLSDQHLNLQELQQLCQRLNARLSPMQQHRVPESDYLEHLRIRMLHMFIGSLSAQTRWGPDEVAAFRQLAKLHEILPGGSSSSSQVITGLLAHTYGQELSRDAAGRVLNELRNFHLREIDQAFGRKLAKGLTGDLSRQFLAASLYSWYCLDPAKAKKYRQLLATFNANFGPYLFPEQGTATL